MKFKIGDTVALKLGSPKMRIEYIVGADLPENSGVFYGPGVHRGAVICKWINEQGNDQGSVFNPEDLQLIDIPTLY